MTDPLKASIAISVISILIAISAIITVAVIKPKPPLPAISAYPCACTADQCISSCPDDLTVSKLTISSDPDKPTKDNSASFSIDTTAAPLVTLSWDAILQVQQIYFYDENYLIKTCPNQLSLQGGNVDGVGLYVPGPAAGTDYGACGGNPGFKCWYNSGVSPIVRCDTPGSFNSFQQNIVSDSRLKFGKVNVDTMQALQAINQLQVKKYNKVINKTNRKGDWMPTPEMVLQDSHPDYQTMAEIGVVAQEVREIPLFAHAVTGKDKDPEGNDMVNELNYNEIFSTALAAIQELSKRVQFLEAQLRR